MLNLQNSSVLNNERSNIRSSELKAFWAELREKESVKTSNKETEITSSSSFELKITELKKTIPFNELFIKYLKDIEEVTSLKIQDKQRERIKNALENENFSRLSPEKNKKHRKEFSEKKKDLIKQWEEETGHNWPRYEKDIYSKNGKLLRQKGYPYDAHHIIECGYKGPNEWWNMHPAAHPDEHQQGIHRKNGPASEIFK